jgi:hypothetical protein
MKMQTIIRQIFDQRWKPLNDENINKINNGNFPGVYLLAYSKEDLEDQILSPTQIYYVGMSNSIGGVKSRLKQFQVSLKDNVAIRGKTLHSAGNRFKYSDPFRSYKHADISNPFKFYVTIKTFPCTVKKDLRTSKDLQIMGEICRLEYFIIAFVKEQTGFEPQLNTK